MFNKVNDATLSGLVNLQRTHTQGSAGRATLGFGDVIPFGMKPGVDQSSARDLHTRSDALRDLPWEFAAHLNSTFVAIGRILTMVQSAHWFPALV
jgi:hypothetical protein